MRHCKRPNSTSERYRGLCNAICLEVPDVRSGSNSDVRARNWAVRFTLKNRRRQPGLSGPKSANRRHSRLSLICRQLRRLYFACDPVRRALRVLATVDTG
jgi:hypothetical protein